MSSNQLNQLLNALIDQWDTEKQNDVEFIDAILSALSSDSLDTILGNDAQALLNIIKEFSTPNQRHHLVVFLKKRPNFQAKRRLQNLDKKFQPKQLDSSDVKNLIEEFDIKRARENELAEVKKQLTLIFANDFLKADDAFATLPHTNHFTQLDYDMYKSEFVRLWVKGKLGIELDSEQALIVGHINGNLKITARAGSGKTRTLVARAIFLIEHCKVPENSILLLAFNRKAADEMRARLKQFLDEKLPHVMTFHALAYALVHPDESLMFDHPNSNFQKQSREIQKLIDSEISKPSFIERIRAVMLEYFRGSWDAIAENTFDASKLDDLNSQRSLQHETLNGEYVKSFGEKIIANILFENSIEYDYERSFKWDGVNYRPDFSIKLGTDSGIAIEYFGLVGETEYDSSSTKKRDFWAKKPNWSLVERFPIDIRNTGTKFEANLIGELQALGLKTRKLSDEEVWRQLRPRAIDTFTKSVKIFIQRCRKLDLSSQELDALISGHDFQSSFEKSFAKIGQELYSHYLALLQPGLLEDFDGLLIRACELLNSGLTSFARNKGEEVGNLSNVQHVLVDEFQDFSMLFYRMLTGIKRNNPSVQFLCVGDDWQAINGFAGSDLSYFRDFAQKDLFQSSDTKWIHTNYRSAARIVNAGNALMREFGDEATAKDLKSGKVLIAYHDQFTPTSFEYLEHQNDEITPLLLRVVHKLLTSHEEITILSRTNRIKYKINYSNPATTVDSDLQKFKKHLDSFLKTEDRQRVSISTTHMFKGLESDAVIVIDANQNSYPLIHPTWEFFRLFGYNEAKIIDEERRLLYVALSRAVTTLVIFGNSSNLSPFIRDPRFLESIEELKISEFPAPTKSGRQFLELSVFKSFNVKDQLKALGFRFHPDPDSRRNRWFKMIPISEFSVEDLNSQPWNDGSMPIEVKTSSGEMIYTNNPAR
jgi:DNA helicase-4